MKRRLFIATRHGLRQFERINDFWEERDHSITGAEVTCVDFQGDFGLVGTINGTYVSRDSGSSWELATQGLQTPHIRWVRIHPQDPRYLFAGTEPANIYSRMVNGPAWKRSEAIARLRDENDWYMPYSPNPGCVRGFAFYSQRVYAAVEVGGLLVSDDRGSSWSLVPGSSGKPHQTPKEGQIHPDVHSVASNTFSKDWVYAPTGGGFFISKDGGANWSIKYQAYCRAVWADQADADHLVLGPADGVGRGGRIERSTDGGETWHPIMNNLVDKWPNAMVERFVAAEGEIFSVLSNGKLLAARTDEFSWQSLLPGIDDAVMVALA